MDPNPDIEILEVMEKHGVSYDEAYARYERHQRQLELAGDRQRAQQVKKSATRKKQDAFKAARQELATAKDNEQQSGL